jgi:ArsR family transcriptional regulator
MSISGVEEPPTDLSRLGEQLKVLAEPKRLRILHMLMEGVQCNCELGDALEMAPNLISHHLRVLREAGWVTAERRGRWIWYSIRPEAVARLRALADEVRPGEPRSVGALLPSRSAPSTRSPETSAWRQW